MQQQGGATGSTATSPSGSSDKTSSIQSPSPVASPSSSESSPASVIKGIVGPPAMETPTRVGVHKIKGGANVTFQKNSNIAAVSWVSRFVG